MCGKTRKLPGITLRIYFVKYFSSLHKKQLKYIFISEYLKNSQTIFKNGKNTEKIHA